MILMGKRGTEKRHDAISHNPVDHALVMVNGLEHVIENRIEEFLCLLRIAVRYYFKRSYDVGKQNGDLFTFALKLTFGCQNPRGEMLRSIVVGRQKPVGRAMFAA
jgi:hypothetical protein